MLHCYYLFDCYHGIITFLFLYISILDPGFDYFLFYDVFFSSFQHDLQNMQPSRNCDWPLVVRASCAWSCTQQLQFAIFPVLGSNIYSSTLLKYNFDIVVLNSSISLSCYYILLLHYSSEAIFTFKAELLLEYFYTLAFLLLSVV